MGTYSLHGGEEVLEVRELEGTCNGEQVIAYLDTLAASCDPDQITVVVLDNAPFHKGAKLRERAAEWQEKGLYLRYLPPYAPFLNLIEEVWRKLTLNGLPLGTTVLLQRGAELWAAEEDLRQWRLREQRGDALRVNGVNYRPLSAYSAQINLDPVNLLAEVDLDPALFTLTALDGHSGSGLAPQQSGSGAVLDYTVATSVSPQGWSSGVALTPKVFGPWGVLQSGLNFSFTSEGTAQPLTVQATTFTWVSPKDGSVVQAGDVTSPSGALGAGLPLGGVLWLSSPAGGLGSDPHPVLIVEGLAARPSRVDVFVEQHLVMSREIPPGPFQLSDVPVSGAVGEARIVLQDDRGARREWRVPFARYAPLLRAGLSESGFAAGFRRSGAGFGLNAYRTPALTYGRRWGISPDLTAELRLDATPMTQNFGVSFARSVQRLGLVQGSASLSASPLGWGAAARLEVAGTSGPWNYGASAAWRSDQFIDPGAEASLSLPAGTSSPRLSLQGSFGRAVGAGYLSVSSNWALSGDQSNTARVTAGYSYPLSKTSTLNLTAAATRVTPVSDGVRGTPKTSLTAAVRLTVPLSSRVSASLSAAPHDAQVTVQQNAAPGSSLSYQVSAAVNERGVAGQAQVGWAAAAANLKADVRASASGGAALNLSASGQVGFLSGHAFASKTTSGARALVRVADFPGVRVSLNGQLVGRTDTHGSLVVTGLKPLTTNWLSIEVTDLPFQAQVGGVRLAVVPLPGNSVEVIFPVHRVYTALLHLTLPNGQTVPAGAVAHFRDSEGTLVPDASLPVAQEGLLYLESPTAQPHLRVSWEGGACEASVDLRGLDDPLPELGAILCSPSK
ncbi:transposase [Deinococcus marmoris]